jgi:hypothetical protein
MTAYTVHRVEQDGTIAFEVYDERPDTYRFVCAVSEAAHDQMIISAQKEAEFIARALNSYSQQGLQ